jgi:cyclopropane fatty-acyl-phospholipid synthase-like methyltransferase
MSLDEAIYAGEDYFIRPKESFVFLGERIAALPGTRLLDIGCARGEFLHYLAGAQPGRWTTLAGTDISEPMITEARRRLPSPPFEFAVADCHGLDLGRRFNLVTACGLLGYIDELAPFFATLARHAEPGGHVLLFGFLNPEEIDVRSEFSFRGHREKANLHSIASVRQEAAAHGFAERALDEFHLPFPLARQADNPRRAWTMETEAGRLFVNGLGQYFRLYACTLERQA